MSALVRLPCMRIEERIAANSANRLKVGDRFPDSTLTRYNKKNERENFSTRAELQGRRVGIVTIPGAFTPVCSTKHVPSYSQRAEEIFKRAVDDVVIVSTDNTDTLRAFLKGHPKVTGWADNMGELADKMGGLNLSGNRGLGYAHGRAGYVVCDATVEWVGRESAAASCSISHADSMLEYLDSLTVNDQAVHFLRQILREQNLQEALQSHYGLRILRPHITRVDLRSLNIPLDVQKTINNYFPRLILRDSVLL